MPGRRPAHVATPVAGFRELGRPAIVAADRSRFVEPRQSPPWPPPVPPGCPAVPDGTPIPTWHDRAEAMASLMVRARGPKGRTGEGRHAIAAPTLTGPDR